MMRIDRSYFKNDQLNAVQLINVQNTPYLTDYELVFNRGNQLEGAYLRHYRLILNCLGLCFIGALVFLLYLWFSWQDLQAQQELLSTTGQETTASYVRHYSNTRYTKSGTRIDYYLEYQYQVDEQSYLITLSISEEQYEMQASRSILVRYAATKPSINNYVLKQSCDCFPQGLEILIIPMLPMLPFLGMLLIFYAINQPAYLIPAEIINIETIPPKHFWKQQAHQIICQFSHPLSGEACICSDLYYAKYDRVNLPTGTLVAVLFVHNKRQIIL